MSDNFTPILRALVAATLLLACMAVMLVTVTRAYAAGALAIGPCGAFGVAYDFATPAQASRSALARCKGDGCRVVATVRRSCASLAIDFKNACGAHGWGKAQKLGRAENVALRACYKDGGAECVIRTFFCDAKG
ncbi:MAG TPA: DUF4189 domain-containing protein [Pseudolabrys sp.]|nr:DUF4189 domain-containing protein [Pseudolabrys sp.]